MKLTDSGSSNAILVRAYAPGEVRIGDQVLRSSCLLLADRIVEWRPRSLRELTVDDMEVIAALGPELVVLGTGSKQRFPHRQLLAALLTRGIGVEVMDCGAACRTYNVLVGEDRRVVAALLLHDD